MSNGEHNKCPMFLSNIRIEMEEETSIISKTPRKNMQLHLHWGSYKKDSYLYLRSLKS